MIDSSRVEPVTNTWARPPRTSRLLAEIVRVHCQDRITIGNIVDGLGDRAFDILMFAFAAPNLPPLGIPGVSSVCAIPLIVLSLQMIAGRRQPSLPRWLRARSMPTRSFRRVVVIVAPWLMRVENLLKPRLAAVTSRTGERAAGAISLILAAVLLLPIPFGNLLPAATIATMGLAMIERDGIAAIIGYLLSIVSLVVALAVVAGSAELVVATWQLLFGP